MSLTDLAAQWEQHAEHSDPASRTALLGCAKDLRQALSALSQADPEGLVNQFEGAIRDHQKATSRHADTDEHLPGIIEAGAVCLDCRDAILTHLSTLREQRDVEREEVRRLTSELASAQAKLDCKPMLPNEDEIEKFVAEMLDESKYMNPRSATTRLRGAHLISTLIEALHEMKAKWQDDYEAFGECAKRCSELEKRLADTERSELQLIDDRDHREEQINQIADALGDDTEWSNMNDRGDNAIDLADELTSELDKAKAELELCVARRWSKSCAIPTVDGRYIIQDDPELPEVIEILWWHHGHWANSENDHLHRDSPYRWAGPIRLYG